MRRTNMQIIEWDLDKTSEGAVFEENVKMHKATVVIMCGVPYVLSFSLTGVPS